MDHAELSQDRTAVSRTRIRNWSLDGWLSGSVRPLNYHGGTMNGDVEPGMSPDPKDLGEFWVNTCVRLCAQSPHSYPGFLSLCFGIRNLEKPPKTRKKAIFGRILIIISSGNFSQSSQTKLYKTVFNSVQSVHRTGSKTVLRNRAQKRAQKPCSTGHPGKPRLAKTGAQLWLTLHTPVSGTVLRNRVQIQSLFRTYSESIQDPCSVHPWHRNLLRSLTRRSQLRGPVTHADLQS